MVYFPAAIDRSRPCSCPSPLLCTYIQLTSMCVQVLVFAHHGEVMDQLERGLRNLGCSLVRIDGGVTGPKRCDTQPPLTYTYIER